MKIAIVTNLYGKYARGGAEKIVKAEADGLAARGHDVVVISGVPKKAVPVGVCTFEFPADCPPPPPGMEDAPHAPVILKTAAARVLKYYPPNTYFYSEDAKHGFMSRLVWHAVDTYNRKSADKLAKILVQEKPDAVHTHNLMGLGFLVPRAIRGLGLRHVHTVHDVQLIHPSGLLPANGRGGRIVSALSSMVTRPLFGSPERVLFPSRYLMTLHERYGFFPASAREVVTNPAPPAGERRAAPASPSFLFVGQLSVHKGIRLLLDVWKGFAASGAKLVIAGSGPLEDEVKARTVSLGGVTFAGKLDTEALSQAYRAATHLVVPSLVIENAPTVILEAASQGTPVIAAAAGGIPELVQDGKNGMLFAPGDYAALTAAMKKAAVLDGWQAMSDAARETVAGFSLDAHLARLEQAYAK